MWGGILALLDPAQQLLPLLDLPYISPISPLYLPCALLDPAQQLLPLLDLDEALEEGARVLGHLGRCSGDMAEIYSSGGDIAGI